MARFHIVLTSRHAGPARTLAPGGWFQRLGAILVATVLVAVAIGVLLVAISIGSILAAFLIGLVLVVSTVARIRTAVRRRQTARGRVPPPRLEGRQS